MNTKLWMKVALVMLVLTLVPVALVSAAGKVNIERKTGTAILGVPANLPQRGPAATPWAFPNNPLGLDKAITPSPFMPLTWKEGWEFAWPNGRPGTTMASTTPMRTTISVGTTSPTATARATGAPGRPMAVPMATRPPATPPTWTPG